MYHEGRVNIIYSRSLYFGGRDVTGAALVLIPLLHRNDCRCLQDLLCPLPCLLLKESTSAQ
jgi:hypothetical protein